MQPAARLYVCDVMHRRQHPVSYRFIYRVFSLLLDIDQLAPTARRLRLLSYNRPGLCAFYDRDHGPRDGSRLRPWVEAQLSACGIDLDGGQIQLLCMPRLLGYVFNPLSIYYCRHRDGTLRAIICEVKNTFGEQSCYILHHAGSSLAWPVRSTTAKNFHVSPFIGMQVDYQFRISEPADDLALLIRAYQEGALLMTAAQTGKGAPLTDRALLQALIKMPLMTLKVIAMIHWQALKLWFRGAPVYRKANPPFEETTHES
ncbi:MAG: DUF1365 domain-containing protein [Pseudomonadota bacterium]